MVVPFQNLYRRGGKGRWFAQTIPERRGKKPPRLQYLVTQPGFEPELQP